MTNGDSTPTAEASPGTTGTDSLNDVDDGPPPSVAIDGLTKRFDGGDVTAVDDLSLSVRDGEFLVLVGPSGCGKTTVLRTIAGLESPTEGTIHIEGIDVTGTDPRGRDVSMVFQNYALYPHKTVAENIAFPLAVRGVPDDEIERRVERTARLLGIESLLDRKPGQLSGGQQQRVALGRAIVREPAVFLMDEPLSNLDAKLRARTRRELAELHRRVGKTTIYVTHDQTEAMTLGDRVAVLRGGRLQQVGPPAHLYDEPANRFVATFLGDPGMNFLDARLDAGEEYRLATDRFSAPVPPSRAERLDGYDDVPEQVSLGIRPEDLHLVTDNPGEPSFEARVRVVEMLGSETVLTLGDGGRSDVDPAMDGEPAAAEGVAVVVDPDRDVAAGHTVTVEPDLSRSHVFDRGTGRNLTAQDRDARRDGGPDTTETV